ncbi:MAG TPA: NAD(P)H-dependent oxidoreductase [Candidatus Tetragenococcus pullicola]|nr:NAD(P)H-dependent oxidoreductase [Candidatus Tetragenococcus pullicola]
MKTLLIISHPDRLGSASQQYLKDSLPQTDQVTVHHLETIYPEGVIDVKAEQTLLQAHDRILLQFPFYWYQAPALLKEWQDQVLSEHFAYGANGDKLKGKELGLVMVIGAAEKEYQVGGREGFTISALTTPFQALAKKTQMQFLKPFLIFQFQYMREKEKMQLLISYQQYLTVRNFDSLKAKEAWYLEKLQQIKTTEENRFVLDQIEDMIHETRENIDEIQMYLDGNL